MRAFFESWGDAALTTLGFFWMALWAFCLGYVVSSMIQVFVTQERMRRTMGETGPRSVALGAFFGFVSSSCSFAALSTTRSLFQKGAGIVPSLAFLLASTNLVIELGILIFIFLSWHFVVGEYLGGVMLITAMWLIVRMTLPKGHVDAAREHAKGIGEQGDDGDPPDWRTLMRSRDGWRSVGSHYFMEWGMVWKDVTFGFTVAGAIAAFVPASFFQALFIGSGPGSDPTWWQIALHTLIGPIAAFLTFIGSMGNIPLAAILFGSGVSFAGVMAFIFSDLVVFPVLRITARYFGKRMAFYILGVFLASLVIVSLALHVGFSLTGLSPDPTSSQTQQMEPGERFAIDYTFFLNLVFVGISAGLWWLTRSCHTNDDHDDGGHQHASGDASMLDKILRVLALASYVWLAGGVAVYFLA
ncbi:MAG: permease [Phycisphaerae bacterium]|nr:permease [Phycisphaerae bacterium]